MTCIICDHPL